MKHTRSFYRWRRAGILLLLACGTILNAQVLTTNLARCPAPLPLITIPESNDPGVWNNQAGLDGRWAVVGPIPMPQMSEPLNTGLSSDQIQIHDVQSGQTRTMNFQDARLTFPNPTAGNLGLAGRGLSDEQSVLDDFLDSTVIADPSLFPWRMNCHLVIYAGGSGYLGSGTLIDPKHVLTAGHCVYNKDTDLWVDSIRVAPGYHEGDTPYGTARSVSMLSWTGWTVNDDWRWDMGMIELDRPVGAITGWFAAGYNTDDAWFTTAAFNMAGYPGREPYYGEQLFYNWGSYDSVTTHILYSFRGPDLGGMSGSGSYNIASGTRTVYAVFSHGYGGYAGDNRITSSKFIDINSWMVTNTPNEVDLVSLDCNASPETVQAGQQLSTFDHLIHNYSDSSYNGTVTASAYLSTNAYISTGDVLLGSGNVNWNWTSKGSVRVNWQEPPTIPVGTAHGNYYLGVIVNFSDYNTANNASHYDDAQPIHIDVCPTIAAPTLIWPVLDTLCTAVPDTYRWHRVSNATSYRVQWDNQIPFVSPAEVVVTDTSAFYTFSTSGTRYWRVRGESACREGAWSSIATYYGISIPSAPVLDIPANSAAICLNGLENYCWDRVPDAYYYQIQWDDNSSFSSPAQTTSSDTCVQHSTPSATTKYWRVRAVNPCGDGAWSTTYHVHPAALVPPSIVIWMTDSTLNMAWSPVTVAESYSVQTATGPSGPFTQLMVTTNTLVTLTRDQPIRFYRVVALHP